MRTFVGAPMVGWYDPRQLAQTAVEVAISTIFGVPGSAASTPRTR